MELLSLLKEGGRYRTYHLSTSVGKRKATTAAIQLTATKKTYFENMKVTVSTTISIPSTITATMTVKMIPDLNGLDTMNWPS